MSLTALKKLRESAKANVLVAAVVVLGVLVYVGKLDAQQMLDTIKYLVPDWFFAHAGEQGAKALANGKKHSVTISEDAIKLEGPAKNA